ncbi:hypothetical protein PI126_g5938 [Phytophthora idaei]|nr:hypothetical protein PI126_g5938 [Phytophthora idaei]
MNCRTIARLVVEQCLPANENALPHVVRSIDAYLTPLLCHEIFTAACEGGASRCILDFLLQRTTPVWKEAAHAAVRGGHLDVIRWMTELQDGRGPWRANFDDGLQTAATQGHLAIVKWLYERGIESDTMREMMESISYIERSTLYVLCSWKALESAAEHGHLEMVQWILTTRTGNIEILDWLNQLGLHVELHTTIPIRQAVGRGDVKLLQWFYWNEFELHDPDLLHLAVQKEQLDAARWLSKHGFKITSLSLIEEAGRKEMVPMLRWLVEHGPPLNFGTAMKLTVEYFHNEIAWWVSESDRVQIVLEALQKEKQDVLGWVLTCTRFENVSSQQRIRDAIQRAPESIILRIEEDLSDLEECKWCFLPTNKRRYSEIELAS